MSSYSVATLAFSGELDICRYPEINKMFSDCPSAAGCVIVDLSRASYVDSVFMTELLLFVRRNTRIRRPVIVAAQGDVGRMLVIGGLDKKVRIVATYEAALDLVATKKSDFVPNETIEILPHLELEQFLT